MITILADNYTDQAQLVAEHGFSALIEFSGSRILFDSGQGKALNNNIKVMGLNDTKIDKVVLSHGHYDHTKGLTDALKKGKALGSALYFHENIFDKHQRKAPDGSYEYIGIDAEKFELIKFYNLYENSEFCQIGTQLYLSGSIPRYYEFHADQRLYVENNNSYEKDMFTDEQFMIIDDEDGLAIITGCSHCGIMNIIEHTKKLFPDKYIKLVLGGFHLFRATTEQINQTSEYLKSNHIGKIFTGHCTGMEASIQMKMQMPEQVEVIKAGMKFSV